MSISKKFNDLSESDLRKRFFDTKFVPKNNLAICFLRVSGKKQERGKSLLEQQEITESYCMREGLKIVNTYSIAETASAHKKRKQFNRITDEITASRETDSPISHFVSSHQSRLLRNPDSAREIDVLANLGVAQHFARDGRKYTNKSDVAELMMWHMENIRNQAFITDLTKNSMGGTIRCIEDGRYPGSKMPFGYKAVGRKDQRHFEHDGDRARYMAMAFEIIDTTYSTERLTDKALKSKLDSMFPGLKTPKHKRFCELLRNPFYTGEKFIYANDEHNADPSIQPAIVDQATWLRVQDILDGRKRVRRLSKTLPYTGMMNCSGRILDESGNLTDELCGCAVTGERIRKKYTNGKTQQFDYYRCSNQTRKCSQRDMGYMKAVVGRKVSYTDREVEVIFQDIFNSFSFDEVTCQKMKQFLWAEHFEAKSNSNSKLTSLLDRQIQLKGFIDRAYEDRLSGLIAEDLWRVKTRQWENERSQVEAEISSLNDSTDEYMSRGVELIELMQHAEIIFKNATAEKKRKMVELVSSNLLLKDGSLEYQWRKPFDMLAVKGDLESWRSQPDLNRCILREREVS